jgi:hypothetical protein
MRTFKASLLLIPLLAAQPTFDMDLPSPIREALRQLYADAGEVRFYEGSTDLNGDEKPEIVVYVIGDAACGVTGCDTLVFTPTGGGSYRRVAIIGSTLPPIRVSARGVRGWSNLIVRVSGVWASTYDVELEHDGERYPEDASAPPARQTEDTSGARTLIPRDASFDNARTLD